MELKSIRCPNCNGPVRQINEKRYVCDSCGTSFMPDYDPEDVDMQRIKSEEEIRKKRLEMAQGMMSHETVRARQSAVRTRVIAIAAVVIFFVIMITALFVFKTIIDFIQNNKFSYVKSGKNQSSYEEAKESLQREHEESVEAYERAQEESKQAVLASYRVTPDDILADEFFVQNAASALRNKLKSNTNLVWTNWVWNQEPEYLTSYLLIAKNDDEWTHNILINIYKVYWDKEYDKGTEHFVIYDGTCLENISLDKDGKIKTDYAAEEMSYHSELLLNQFICGYLDYDDLIRQEIYGNYDYDYVEFHFPGAAGAEIEVAPEDADIEE